VPTCSSLRNGCVLPRVTKVGVQLLRKDCRNTIAEIVEYDCIPIFSGSCLSSGQRMIKDVIIS
jgi:hypothetical protein